MHVPAELSPMEAALAEHFPHLRPAQVRGLALWVCGAILAHSACQSAVLAALLAHGGDHALRQRRREWLDDGADRTAPCATALAVEGCARGRGLRSRSRAALAVEGCFAPLLRWVLVWWRGDRLALAVDATLHGDRLAALVVSVLYRGGAIPVAGAILPANTPGPWLEPILGRLGRLHAAVPVTGLTVSVLADRGLWSPRLWQRGRDLGWHPLLRVQNHATFAPDGGARGTARDLVRPGAAWVGRGRLGASTGRRLTVTLVAVWAAAQREPWVVVTDLPPARVGVSWYALRVWAELGFRALKGVGWRWRHTRRTAARRTARHWLVLAVATLWVLAHGTRAEDARRVGVAPARLRTPPAPPGAGRRIVSLFRLGLQCLRRRLGRGRLWRRLWLVPEPWPQPPPDLVGHVHGTAEP